MRHLSTQEAKVATKALASSADQQGGQGWLLESFVCVANPGVIGICFLFPLYCSPRLRHQPNRTRKVWAPNMSDGTLWMRSAKKTTNLSELGLRKLSRVVEMGRKFLPLLQHCSWNSCETKKDSANPILAKYCRRCWSATRSRGTF